MKRLYFLPYLFISISLIFILLFSGCQKSKEKKIIGTWMQVYFSSVEEFNKDTIIWTFDSKQMIRYQSYMRGGVRKYYQDTSDYRIKRKNLEWIVIFDNKGEKTMSISSKYVIDKLKKGVLILIPLEAYPRMEMTKIN